MTNPTPRPYGSWPSPITIDAMLASGTGLGAVGVDGKDVLWLEQRPGENGRSTLVRRRDDQTTELTPAPANVRGRVMEYGGGAWGAAGGIVVWTDDNDSAVHLLEGDETRRITPADRQFCFGDFVVVPRHRFVLAIREDHHDEGEARTAVVALQMDSENTDGGQVLIDGADFYIHPALSDNDRLAWVEWSHPNMPWDGSRLMVAPFTPGQPISRGRMRQVAGDDEISVAHPLWAGDRLVHLSDEKGYWQPWVLEGDERRRLSSIAKDFCRPIWVLGNAAYALADEDTLAMYCYSGARAKIALVSLVGGRTRFLDEPVLADVDSIAAGPAGVFAIVDHADKASELVRVDIDEDAISLATLRSASADTPDPAWVSMPQSIWFDGQHGRSQAWYHPPTSPGSAAPEGELPPMIVNTHGGPTGMATSAYRTAFQYWTSRGFAILDINYSGSAGFGREYRNRLYKSWGIADIDDCIDAVKAVVERGLADPKRVAIRGGSAGGYTTLQSLVSTDIFAAGVSSYGIGDLEMLVGDTHKFESRYPYKLVGPYPPAKQTYIDRSPIHHVDQLSSPMLIMQGLDDKVVPPNQAVAMADAVRAKKLPVALLMFEGEGHGFRQESTRRAALEAQLSFYSQLFGFTPADEVPHLEVENL